MPRASPIASIGIDVAEARKGIDLVALDANRAVRASHGRLTEGVIPLPVAGVPRSPLTRSRNLGQTP